jgi:uncharacterized protein with GYD domain
MPKYLFEAFYGPEGVKGVAAKGGSARRDAIEQLFSSSGGSLEGFYFAFGDADVYAFGELPSNETATAVALQITSTGQVKVRTVVLLTPEEVDAAAKASVDYRAPGG